MIAYYTGPSSVGRTQDLQQDLAALEDWEKQWQMDFHPEKCVVIQISSKQSTIPANYTLHNHQLEVVDSSKYLGVTINKNLRWDDHINNITARANRTLGFLKRNLRGCKTSARARAYETIVRPTLKYAASIWDPYNTGQINQLEKVQRRAARFTTKNYRQTARKCHSDGNPTWMGTTPG
jgi:myo-inositol-hexaphosphate 3-phosphohydrolase